MSASDGVPIEFRDYLDALMGGASNESFVEMRSRVGETGMAARFFQRDELDRLAAAVSGRARVTDVYIGCAPRSRRQGDKAAIREVWTLWVECDGADSAAATQRLDPAPALVIASGSGENVHAYWPLRSPLPPPDAEAANLRLATAVGADMACFDATRILRPPGT